MNEPRAEEHDELERVVAAMAKIGSCWSPSFSPDGTRIAFVSNLSGLPQVWTVAAQGGWPELVTALDDQVMNVAWSPAGDWLAFALAPGGGMNQQIYIVRPDGSDLRRLTDGGKRTTGLAAGPMTAARSRLARTAVERTRWMPILSPSPVAIGG